MCTNGSNRAALLMQREHANIDRRVQRVLQASAAFVDRLEQEAILRGHEGCVNCLEWNSAGSILASGSDDYHVILWDAFRKRQLCNMRTKHNGNMFSVKFLPRHDDAWLATAAADKCIYVFDINRPADSLLSCKCHTARVKRLATAPDSPFVFWSAGEDGAVLQLDTREKHTCRAHDCRVRLIQLSVHSEMSAEAKCLAINPLRSEYLAVGANDPFARIYDRRMLKPLTMDDRAGLDTNNSKECVSYFCPGHINKNNSRMVEHESRAITYLTFNNFGTELLVNMGGEHIYLYDLLKAQQPVFLNIPELPTVAAAPDVHVDEKETANANHHRRVIPHNIEAYKKVGNDLLENEKYLRAIEQYSEAIALAPDCAVLYLNRATALMRRKWFGDVYDALRDCQIALQLDPSYIKAQFRMARALLELGRAQEAAECLQELVKRFPSYAQNHGVVMLNKDIHDSKQTTQSNQASESYNTLELTDAEFQWRSKAKDYDKRFVGHCNTTTDIKEANYFGFDADYIAAGSDDGNLFIWQRRGCKIRAIYKADGAIVNCVQPHPYLCMLATSGIDHDIKIWSPIAKSSEERPNLCSNVDKCVESNQQKMKTDPFDLNTRSAYCWNG